MSCSCTQKDIGFILSETKVHFVKKCDGAWTFWPLVVSWKQTLSSLALVFALHHYKPTPLYVMDEIDAALGKSNPHLRLRIPLCRSDLWPKSMDSFPFVVLSIFDIYSISSGYISLREALLVLQPGGKFDKWGRMHICLLQVCIGYRFQECVNRGSLHQGTHKRCSVCDYQVQITSSNF